MITDLPHNARMIHGAVTLCSFQLMARGSLIDRLDAALEHGDQIEPESAEERSLAEDIRTLRMLAHELERRRALLLDNAMPRFLLIEQRKGVRPSRGEQSPSFVDTTATANNQSSPHQTAAGTGVKRRG